MSGGYVLDKIEQKREMQARDNSIPTAAAPEILNLVKGILQGWSRIY